ncbi:uncharacterized protein LOC135384473 [Ornithodoros turicata]|uniref:uncharacterized protein LOC135384473 n=1 Tax=Ornithodoros turicata TaxID=34597 RepID=UPI003138E2E7
MRTTEGNTVPVSSHQGLPQGGVMSPTLFNIIMAELIPLLPKEVKITVYADDVCMWAYGRYLSRLKATLELALDTAATFFQERAMDLSPDKTVYIPFTKKRLKNFTLKLRGEEILRVNSHRFLGVNLHRTLAWTPELKKLKNNTKTYTNIMKIIAGHRWGSTKALFNVHQALIRQSLAPSILHLNSITPTQENKLNSILAASLRVCLGVPRTTRAALVIAEAREPPATVLRSQEKERQLIRLLTRHTDHSLIKKIESWYKSSAAGTLKRLQRQLPKRRLHTLKQDRPPWLLHRPKVHDTIPGITKKSEIDASVLKTLTMTYMEERHASKNVIYTDGSTKEGRSASGVVAGNTRKGYRLSHGTSSTASELHGILKAVRYIKTCTPADWLMCTDSKPSLQSIIRGDTENFLLYRILTATDDATQAGHSVTFQWIPSHCGIPGNEEADILAKGALEKTRLSAMPFTKADAKRHLKLRTQQRSNLWWRDNIRPADDLSHIDPDLATTFPRGLDRRLQTSLHRIRLGALYSKTTLYQMRSSPTPLCTACNTPEDTLHVIMQCPVFQRQRDKLQATINKMDRRPFSFVKLLGAWPSQQQQDKATKALCTFLKDTGVSTTF